jgi:hypothetical protein
MAVMREPSQDALIDQYTPESQDFDGTIQILGFRF